jgi:hypothetical protein
VSKRHYALPLCVTKYNYIVYWKCMKTLKSHYSYKNCWIKMAELYDKLNILPNMTAIGPTTWSSIQKWNRADERTDEWTEEWTNWKKKCLHTIIKGIAKKQTRSWIWEKAKVGPSFSIRKHLDIQVGQYTTHSMKSTKM